jgi:predicted HicB family RNase H-like nuclease
LRTCRVPEGNIVGRKKMKAKAMEKIDIRLRVDAELHRRIAAAADQEGNSVAAFIRSAVVKELKRREREDDKPQGDS